ncbi:MAG: YgaP family membrane protein [Acetobacterium sp.]
MKNVGKTDKIIRIILGLGLLSLIFILQGNIRFIGLIGIIPIVTALTGFCPIYGLLHLSTNKKPKE